MIVTGRTKKTIQVKADGKTEEKVEKITVQEADQNRKGYFFIYQWSRAIRYQH